MVQVLEAFANDGILPGCYKPDSKYCLAMDELTKSEEELRDMLNEVQRKQLDQVISAQIDVNYLSTTDRFIYGYRLGVLMTMEVFTGSDELLTNRRI